MSEEPSPPARDGVHRRLFSERLGGALRCDGAVYRELKEDPAGAAQGARVVALASLAAALGSADTGLVNALGALTVTWLGWLLWAASARLLGAGLLRASASRAQIRGALGFAFAPGMLAVLGILPGMGWLVAITTYFWMLLVGVLALRVTLEFGTGRALAAALPGWLVLVLLAAAFAW